MGYIYTGSAGKASVRMRFVKQIDIKHQRHHHSCNLNVLAGSIDSRITEISAAFQKFQKLKNFWCFSWNLWNLPSPPIFQRSLGGLLITRGKFSCDLLNLPRISRASLSKSGLAISTSWLATSRLGYLWNYTVISAKEITNQASRRALNSTPCVPPRNLDQAGHLCTWLLSV